VLPRRALGGTPYAAQPDNARAVCSTARSVFRRRLEPPTTTEASSPQRGISTTRAGGFAHGGGVECGARHSTLGKPIMMDRAALASRSSTFRNPGGYDALILQGSTFKPMLQYRPRPCCADLPDELLKYSPPTSCRCLVRKDTPYGREQVAMAVCYTPAGPVFELDESCPAHWQYGLFSLIRMDPRRAIAPVALCCCWHPSILGRRPRLLTRSRVLPSPRPRAGKLMPEGSRTAPRYPSGRSRGARRLRRFFEMVIFSMSFARTSCNSGRPANRNFRNHRVPLELHEHACAGVVPARGACTGTGPRRTDFTTLGH